MKAPTRPSSAWEVGSDFDRDSVWTTRTGGTRLPAVAGDEHVTFMASGRQALGAAIDQAVLDGCDTVLFPAHYCESMLEPFVSRGWDVLWVSVSPEWTLIVPDVLIPTPDRTMVYSLSFFGVPESVQWLEYVDRLRGVGAKVLSDETHRVLDRGQIEADYRVASLRKMLPVPDGAFLTGVKVPVGPAGGQGLARWQAMGVKADQLANGQNRTYLELFEAAEQLTDVERAPGQLCPVTETLLGELDYSAMWQARKANSTSLLAALHKSRFHVTTKPAPVPSHHVLQGLDVMHLRRHLIEARVFTPVHWPAPVGRPSDAWRSDVLSIPVDHRYTPKDMDRVAELIHDYERRSL